MRTFVLALMLAMLAVPAYAQSVSTNKPKLQNDGPQKEENKPKADDKAYGNALGNLPNKKYDPWANMR